ncbi:hypothetical protein ECPA10_5650, partial [Escherichia coli PA10]
EIIFINFDCFCNAVSLSSLNRTADKCSIKFRSFAEYSS